MATTGPLDPIDLEIQWGRCVTIMNETDTVLVRTSFSTIVGEGRDFACILLDERGYALAQSTLSTTLFTIAVPRTVRQLLSIFPPETLVEGDVLLTNDPWLGTGHLFDFVIVRPVFRGGRPVAYIGTAAHIADIGGRGGYVESRDLFEEGLQLPPCKLYKAGVPNDDILRILARNVRVPDQVIGDVYAIVAAENVGAQRLLEFMDDYGYDDLNALGHEIHSRSEGAMRTVLRNLPDGEWRYELMTDGFIEPVKIAARVAITGDELLIDFEGTSPQTTLGAVNCVLNATLGDALVAVKCAFAPDIPNNEGLFRPVTVQAPPGSILNCDHGFPVRARDVVALHTHEAIYGALAPLVGDRVQAGTGTFWQIIVNCVLPNGRRANAYLISRGGKGAVHNRDGLSCIAFPTNGTMAQTEIFENRVPVRIEEKDLLPDSGGPGRYRGGLGQRVTLVSDGDFPVTVSLRPSNVRLPTPGLLGAGVTPLSRWEFNGQPMDEKRLLYTMQRGDCLSMCLAGGGGFYSPLEREPEQVRQDVAEGRLTTERASADYGVVIDPHTHAINWPETARQRGA